MSSSVVMAIVVGIVMLVYLAFSLRTLVRLRNARALVLAADMPEGPDSRRRAISFSTAREWFAGKECASCRRPIPPLHHMGPQPGLRRRSPGHHPVLTWSEFPSGQLHLISETYEPLCSSCQISESLKEDYPNLVMERQQREGSTMTDR